MDNKELAQNIRTAMAKLRKVDGAQVRVDMLQGTIKHEGGMICGCMGVHYSRAVKPWWRGAVPIFCMHDFAWGANQLAQDLGFSETIELTDWVARNRELWGNNIGSMFTDPAAYGCTKDTITLGRVIDHWLGVADRVQEAFEKEYEAAVAQGEAV